MSKLELQKAIKSEGGREFSIGTLNLNHLLAEAYDTIVEWDLKGNPFKYIQSKSFRSEIKDCFIPTEGNNISYPLYNAVFFGHCEISREKESEAHMIWEEVCNYFDSLAPNGYYFGSTEGNGSEIGWWKLEEDGEEF